MAVLGSLGRYRLEVLRDVLQQNPGLEIYAGERSPDGTVRVLQAGELPFRALRNYYLPRGILIQFGIPIRRALRARILLLDLNPRSLSTWPLLFARRVLGRPTVLWGHAWPRRGRFSRTERVRRAMRGLADGLLTYTETEAAQLRQLHPRSTIIAAPNSLYRREQIRHEPEMRRDTFIYVGRLVAAKKVDLAVRAYARVVVGRPDMRLTIIGAGPERQHLEQCTRQLAIGGHVDFVGQDDDIESLRGYYSRAIASLGPGYIGLSAIQSFSFGVPMLVADLEPHAPEVEAIRPGLNAFYFRANDVESLAAMMSLLADARNDLLRSGDQIAADCANRYTVESMASGISAIIERLSVGGGS
jgi:glycosyltransferase involved in cell wall biosynthesis